MDAKIVSFINLKGGVGKTTLCLTIGEMLVFALDKKVLMIDIDAQSNLSFAIVTKQILDDYKEKKASIYHLFLNLLHPGSYKQKWDIKNAIVNDCTNIQKIVLEYDDDYVQYIEVDQNLLPIILAEHMGVLGNRPHDM